MLFGGAIERFGHGDDLAGRLAAGDSPGVRRAHHNAFEYGLAADESFFSAFKSRKKLNRSEESEIVKKTAHSYWMLLCGARRTF
jgi:hypothetical protein